MTEDHAPSVRGGAAGLGDGVVSREGGARAPRPARVAARRGAGATRRSRARAGSSRHGSSGAGGAAPSPLQTSPAPDPIESSGGEGGDGSRRGMALQGGAEELGRQARAAARRARAAAQRSETARRTRAGPHGGVSRRDMLVEVAMRRSCGATRRASGCRVSVLELVLFLFCVWTCVYSFPVMVRGYMAATAA